MVYFAYMLTMLLLMLKTLCGQKISADNSKAFQPTYMTYMANKLCETLIEKANQEFR